MFSNTDFHFVYLPCSVPLASSLQIHKALHAISQVASIILSYHEYAVNLRLLFLDKVKNKIIYP